MVCIVSTFQSKFSMCECYGVSVIQLFVFLLIVFLFVREIFTVVCTGDACNSEGSLFRKQNKICYYEGPLFRNTQIAYIKMFVSPKIKNGSLIQTFVALFRRFLNPKIQGSLFRRFVNLKMKLDSLFRRSVSPNEK